VTVCFSAPWRYSQRIQGACLEQLRYKTEFLDTIVTKQRRARKTEIDVEEEWLGKTQTNVYS
jgi:hypothetical protein